MSEQAVHAQWRDSQEGTNYPFSPSATLQDRTVGQILPVAAFVDASIYWTAMTGIPRLSRVLVGSESLTLNLGDDIDDVRASCVVDWNSIPDLLSFTDSSGRSCGVLICSPSLLGSLLSWGIGTYTFGVDDAGFSAKCAVGLPEEGVWSIKIDQGVVAGHVWLVGESGVVFTVEDGDEVDQCDRPGFVGPVIRMHVTGDPLFKRSACEDDAEAYVYETPTPILKLHVIHGDTEFDILPDEAGNITIAVASSVTPDTVLRAYPSPTGLLLAGLDKDNPTDNAAKMAIESVAVLQDRFTGLQGARGRPLRALTPEELYSTTKNLPRTTYGFTQLQNISYIRELFNRYFPDFGPHA